MRCPRAFRAPCQRWRRAAPCLWVQEAAQQCKQPGGLDRLCEHLSLLEMFSSAPGVHTGGGRWRTQCPGLPSEASLQVLPAKRLDQLRPRHRHLAPHGGCCRPGDNRLQPRSQAGRPPRTAGRQQRGGGELHSRGGPQAKRGCPSPARLRCRWCLRRRALSSKVASTMNGAVPCTAWADWARRPPCMTTPMMSTCCRRRRCQQAPRAPGGETSHGGAKYCSKDPLERWATKAAPAVSAPSACALALRAALLSLL